MNDKIQQPNTTEPVYLTQQIVLTKYNYNPKYGDDRICVCGHSYYRHFDPYDDMEAIGCKYCECSRFVEDTNPKTNNDDKEELLGVFKPHCCHRCDDDNKVKFSHRIMIVCPICQNKRCPKASDHRLDCTGSNEKGQPGSIYT